MSLAERDALLSFEAATIIEDKSQHAMMCLRPDEKAVEKIAKIRQFTEPMEEIHITLVYLGEIGKEAGDERDRERLYRGCYDFALHGGFSGGLHGKMNGYGVFMNDGEYVLVGLWDLPDSATFRSRLLDSLSLHGYQPRKDDHGFTPHTTISYADTPFTSIPSLPEGGVECDFTSIWLAWGEEWQEIPLR